MALTEQTNKPEENNVVAAQIGSEKQDTLTTPSTQQNMEFDGEIDLSATRRKRFRIDGDNNRYLELNTSDMGVFSRLEQLYPRLQKLSQDAAVKKLDAQNESDEDTLSKIAQTLTKIDMEMREILDDIFDSNVSELCAPEGTLMDPFNGEFRFEHIIDVISRLYTNNLNSEYKKMNARMKKRTSKYTKGR